MTNSALMIAFHFPPQAGSSGIQRTLSFSRYLGGFGWQPLVLSANAIAYASKNSSQLADVSTDVVVKRAFALDAKRHLGIMGRYPEVIALPDRWSTWWISAIPTALSMVRKHRPSVIWSTFPIATSHLIGLTLQRLTGLPWVADFRDPMLQDGFPTLRWQRRSYAWIEQQSILRCDRAVFTTHAAMSAYKARFDKSLHYKFSVIENGYDEDAFNFSSSEQLSSSDLRRPITLLHSGVLYNDGRDPSAFLQAIARLREQGDVSAAFLRVVLRAPGDIPYMKSLVEQHGVGDIVQVEPPTSYQEALREMLSVDGLLVFQGSQFNTQVPAKIYEYFRSRRPVFALLDPSGETAKVLGAAGFSNTARINVVEEIAPALRDFIKQIREGCAYIANDELVQSSSRRYRTQELGQLFDAVISPRRSSIDSTR